MVGTQSQGPDWLPVSQRAHEGHPGWTINQIKGLESTWTSLAPDVVLIKAGTNDAGQGHSNASMAADLDALLAALRSSLPRARLFITSILNLPDSQKPGLAATITFYNKNTVPTLASRYNATFVDIAGASGMCVSRAAPRDPKRSALSLSRARRVRACVSNRACFLSFPRALAPPQYGPDSPLVNLCAVCNGPCGGYNPNSCPPAGYSYCHPTAAGYNVMAGLWSNALLPVLRELAVARAPRQQ